MSAKRSIGDSEILKKRIPQNLKYQHIKTRLDTGNSMTKYLEKIEEIKKNYRYKKDELFKRIKVTTFAQLVLQVASVSEERESGEMTTDELQRLEDNSSVISDTEFLTDRTNGKGSPVNDSKSPIQFIDSERGEECIHTSRSTLQSVISGVGELDLGNQADKKKESLQSSSALDKPYEDCPFLLLDVRDRDSYDQCHVVGAKNYPIAMLSRTMNPFTPEILEYVSFYNKCVLDMNCKIEFWHTLHYTYHC
ncbi:hypothetical protein XENTR_v10008884 [Xenopus tropicalis]|nr:hypothetical protein XENTR_v10008884 [Xenopus tropicalis]